MRQKDYPLLVGFIENNYPSKFPVIRVWCPHCRKWHIHGWTGGNRPEHRCAHCRDGSPFLPHGYYIKPVSRADMKRLGIEVGK